MTQLHRYFSVLGNKGKMLRYGFGMAVMVVMTLTAIASTAFPAPPAPETCAFLEQFHGHTCAGSLMGLRLGLVAEEAMGDHGKLKAKCSLLACPVDGIQIGAKATYGNKALEVEDKDELCLILTDIQSGRQVEARLTEKAVEMGKRFREFSGKARSYKAGSHGQHEARKEADDVLDWFRTAADTDVVSIRVLN